MLERLHHLALATADLDASVDVYERLFGRPPDLYDREAGPSAWFALRNGALELRHSPSSASDLDRPLELGFVVDDLERAEQEARRRGLAPTRRDGGVDLDPGTTGGVPMTLLTERLARSEGPLEAPAVHGLDHVVVRTRNADLARSLYEEALGIRVALDREFEQWGVRLVFCRLAGVTLELAASLAGGEGGDALARAVATGDPDARDTLWGVTWQVADAEAARARLAGNGFDVSEVREGRKPGTRVFSVRDGTRGIPTLVIQPAERGSRKRRPAAGTPE